MHVLCWCVCSCVTRILITRLLLLCCLFSRQEWASSGGNRYNLVIINDRLMSETVQSEHSYFNHGIDDDSSHSSTFKGKSRFAGRNFLSQACSMSMMTETSDDKIDQAIPSKETGTTKE